MKKFVILGAVALLAACGSKPEPAATPTDAMGAASAPAMGAASGGAMGDASGGAIGAAATLKTGVFDYVSANGSKGTTVIMADGKYVDRDDKGKVQEKGTAAMKDGKTCFTPEKGAEHCYTDSAPDADGNFTATAADGKVTKVSAHKKK